MFESSGTLLRSPAKLEQIAGVDCKLSVGARTRGSRYRPLLPMAVWTTAVDAPRKIRFGAADRSEQPP
jgi:hypothetical protein